MNDTATKVKESEISKKMKKRPVNLDRSDENIADQYPNIYEGLQKDAGQNSWDARLTKKGKDWKLIFKYIPKLNCLIIEDFGTTGMDEEGWIKYQSLWDTTKAEEDTLGARGQGKFLFHYFALEKLVLTESIDGDGNYRFSYGTAEEWDDEHKTLRDFIPSEEPLSHQGTRIWIMDIKKELKGELLDFESFMKYIEATWWEIIRNYGAIFIVNFDGTDRQVTLPKLPAVAKEKPYLNERIKDLGRIRNLVIRYCRENIPEHCRGIAVQRGGMTIQRLRVAAEESIKNKIYGYCNFDDSLETELKKIELPNHFGFTNKRAWNHVKDFVLKRLDEFVQEITPRKQKLEIEEKLLSEAAKIVNDLVAQYAPELAGKFRTGPVIGPQPPSPPPPPKPPLRIDIFRGNARKFEYNETLITDCELVNELEDKKEVHLEIAVKHKEGTRKFHSKYNFVLSSGERKKVDVPLIDFKEGEDKAGEYRAVGVLKNTKTAEELSRRTFIFYLHEEPPIKGKGFMTTFEIIRTGKGLLFEKWRNLPINEKGVVHVIWDHSDFIHARELVTTKRAKSHEIFLYLVKVGIDEAQKALLELRYNDNSLDLETIRDIKQLHDEMYYDALLRI